MRFSLTWVLVEWEATDMEEIKGGGAGQGRQAPRWDRTGDSD